MILIILEFKVTSSKFQGADIIKNKVSLPDQKYEGHNNWNLSVFPNSVFGTSRVDTNRNIHAYFIRHGNKKIHIIL